MRGRALVRFFLFFLLALAALISSITGCSGDDATGPRGEFVDAQTSADAASETSSADATAPKPDARVDAAPDATPAGFNVSAAASTGNGSMTVTFDAPPNAAQAVVLANYDVPDLTLSGVPVLAGNVVTLETSAQAAQSYTVTVSGVTRASDGAALTVASQAFQGRTGFNVASAAATSNKTLTVTFDAPPNAAAATTLANYDVPGLTLSAPQLAGNVVTLTTTAQAAQTYTVTVANVTRASDAEPLAMATADFGGRLPFSVASAASPSSVSMTVTFDAPPSAAATTLANYTVPGLTLSGTPVLVGSTVTITTSAQSAQTYTVTVGGVVRASDSEPLDGKTADFTGTAVLAPTVTNVEVLSTNPNNAATAYNTGATTVKITGTDLATVDCVGGAMGVKLDDLNGLDAAVGTTATSCTVVSDTEITATFPAGIRTNGATGWNVIVTNTVASNTTSAVHFVPKAGLLISEVLVGAASGTGASDHEFVEIYNPTATSIDITAATGIGLHLHVRSGAAVPSDVSKTLTAVAGGSGVIASHGFLLFASSASSADDDWHSHRDFTYSAGLTGSGGVYLSLTATDQARVIDKVGFGTQPAGGYEGTATAAMTGGSSIERKPAGGVGHATDTDSNVDDFNAASTTLTPRGTVDGAEP